LPSARTPKITGPRLHGARADPRDEVIIHDAAPGADALVGQWAIDKGMTVGAFPGDVLKHGPATGSIRNAQMLEGKPHLIVTFPDGPGTANVMQQARAAGVRVVEPG